ncbi:MAG: hypothetical protein CR974_01080 [Gammaproteobacteria bacterium]|nr:MAG: hypothetical protein CR974_01080 [Gammaproteobacteria bacterium]
MKKQLPILLLVALLAGCANYFSNYRTVYRIETTTGQRYYSDSEPDFDASSNTYEIEDLDGNEYQLSKGRIHKIQKFKHKK